MATKNTDQEPTLDPGTTEVTLAPAEAISRKKTLNTKIYIFLDPESKEVDSIIADFPFGLCSYDKDLDRWVATPTNYSWRIHELFNNYISYEVDWKNDQAFDEKNKSLALVKYVDGTLDENWLEENTIFSSGPARKS